MFKFARRLFIDGWIGRDLINTIWVVTDISCVDLGNAGLGHIAWRFWRMCHIDMGQAIETDIPVWWIEAERELGIR